MSYATMLIEKYRSRGLLLDSNLLLLYLIGTANPAFVGTGQYNKLSSFTVQQLYTLNQLLSFSNRTVTTAHILTEVSNLVSTLHDTGRLQAFRTFAETLEIVEEQQISSYQAARRKEFLYLGLTDSVLAELADRFLIISNDGRMIDTLR